MFMNAYTFSIRRFQLHGVLEWLLLNSIRQRDHNRTRSITQPYVQSNTLSVICRHRTHKRAAFQFVCEEWRIIRPPPSPRYAAKLVSPASVVSATTSGRLLRNEPLLPPISAMLRRGDYRDASTAAAASSEIGSCCRA